MPTLTPEENQVLAVKYKSTAIGQLKPIEVITTSKALLLKIAIITGWVIPENELQNVLVDQFQKLLIEKYATCNPDEVEYAFRTYGTVVQDWGKQMNLSLIDAVMIPYINHRVEISKHEEAHKLARLQFKPKEDLSDQAMEDWLNHTRDSKTSLEFMPLMLYDWLIKKEMISPTSKVKWEYMKKASAYQQVKLAKACDELMSPENRAALAEFNKMKEADEFTGKVAEDLKSLAKKMILYDYINF